MPMILLYSSNHVVGNIPQSISSARAIWHRATGDRASS